MPDPSAPSSGGVTDHGALTGLSDDDHPQYATNTEFDDHSARHENGGADELSIAGLDGTPTELTNHLNDTTDAHDASAVSIVDAGTYFTGTTVEDALQELAAGIGGANVGELTQDDFVGDGVEDTFTLSAEPVDGVAVVTINGAQALPSEYAITGTALVFDDPPANLDEIVVTYTSVSGGLALDDVDDVDTTGVSDGDVLTYDSGEWVAAAPTGGSGSGDGDGKPFLWTPPSSADAMDDEFNDTSGMSGPTNGLDSKWSLYNMGTSSWRRLSDDYAPGCFGFDIPTGQATNQFILQAVPGGAFRVFCRFQQVDLENRQMWGLVIADGSGNGMCMRLDTGETNSYVQEVSGWNPTGSTTSLLPELSSAFTGRAITNLWLAYDGSTGVTIAGAPSDRARYALSPSAGRTKSSWTPTHVGFGRLYGTGRARVLVEAFRREA